MTERTWEDVLGRDVGAVEAMASYWAARGGGLLRLPDWLTLQCLELYGEAACDGVNWDAMARQLERDAAGDVAWAVEHDHGDALDLADSIMLTTSHASSSYGRPVLLIGGDGTAYGPGDMTPAGVTGAELVNTWARRFAG